VMMTSAGVVAVVSDIRVRSRSGSANGPALRGGVGGEHPDLAILRSAGGL
jgi:hypothetical protein